MITQQSSSDIISNDFMSFMKNGRVKHGTWKKIENHKIYAKWLGKILGYEYIYISIWEREWIRGKNSIIKLQQIFKDNIQRKYSKKIL